VGLLKALRKQVEPKPSSEEIKRVFQALRQSARGSMEVKPEDDPVINLLEKRGLVKVEFEKFLDARKGLLERKTAWWVGGWACSGCVNFFVGDLKEKRGPDGVAVVIKNVKQCRKGFSLQFTDALKGKRCPHFVHREVARLLGGEIGW
jgi:hypothetical protein